MKLPMTCWKRTLQSLGFKVANRSSSSKRNQSQDHSYELLEHRQLLASDLAPIAVADSLFDRIFHYSADGSNDGSYSISESRSVRGTAISQDGRLQLVVDANKRVYVFDKSNNSFLGNWSTTGLASPQGIAIDGDDVLIVDQSKDRVYRFEDAIHQRGGSLSPDSSFTLRFGNKRPSGLTTDGEKIWVVDRGSDRVFVYGMEGQRLGNWKLDSHNRHPTGVAIDPDGGEKLWVVNELDGRVFVYDQGRSALSGNLSADSSFKLRFFNWFPQGIAINPSSEVGPPVPPTIASISNDTGVQDNDGITNDSTLIVAGFAEPGASVSLNASTVGSLGTAVADLDGNWSIDASTITLDDGQYALTAIASNANGQSDPSNAFQVLVDTIAPTQPILVSVSEDTGESSLDQITADNTIVVSGTAEPNSQVTLFETSLGQLQTVEVNAQGVWQVDLTADVLPDGAYQFTAFASDAAGNQSELSSPLNVVIDSDAPAQPSIESISSDTGRSSSDGVTQSGSQTLFGSAEPNTRVRVFLDGVELTTTLSDSSGAWSVDAELDEGSFEFVAEAFDSAGNTSIQSSPFQLVIDQSAPPAPEITGFDEDTNLADGVTSDNTLTLIGTAEPLNIIAISESNLGELGQVTADATGQWSFELPITLADASYRFTATAEDVAGNISGNSQELAVLIDTINPSVPSITIIEQDTGSSNSDGVTNDSTLVLSGFAEPESVVVVSDNSLGLLGQTQANAQGVWTLDLTATPFEDGDYSLIAVSQDLAGNQSSASSEFALIVDTSSPSRPEILSIDADTGASNNDGVTSDPTLVFRGTGEPGATATLFETTLGNVGTALVDEAGNWTIDLTDRPLSDGSYSFSTVQVDVAGNASDASDAFIVVVQTGNPNTPSIVRIDDDSGSIDNDGVTNDSTLLISGTGPANTTILVFESTAGLLGTAIVSATGTWSLDLSSTPFADGQYSLTAIAEDLSGNLSPSSTPLVVTVDTTNPNQPTIDGFDFDTGQSNTDGVTSDNEPILFGTAEPNSQVAIVESSLGELASTITDANGVWQVELGQLADGTYSLSAIATDLAGNTSVLSDTQSIVIDTVAPPAPSIVSIARDTGASDSDGVTSDTTLNVFGLATAGSLVTLREPTLGFEASVMAENDGTWTVDVSIIVLSEGVYQFEATATDLAGNESPASTPFTVVVDTTAPDIDSFQLAEESDSAPIGDSVTNQSAVTLEGTTEAGVSVTLQETGQNTTADSNGAFSFANVALAIGSNSFTVIATDLAGNESTRSEVITRIDPTNSIPMVFAQLLNDTGSSSRDLTTTDPTLVGTVTHEGNVTAEFVLEYDGPEGRAELRADMTPLLTADGSFEVTRGFLDSMFDDGGMPFGLYQFSIIATDASNTNLVGYHFGELLFVPEGADSPPIAVGIGLQNDTGPIATDRLSTDPTLVGFVDGTDVVSVEFYYDSAGPGLSADITSLIDASGNFVLDQAFLESVIGEPLDFRRHDYHIVANDSQGNFAFKFNYFGYLESDDDDITKPVLDVGLKDDTGISDRDNITNDLTLIGSVEDESEVSLYVLVFNVDTFEEFEGDISDLLQLDGTFELPQSRLEQLAGGPLEDGGYVIDVFAADRYSETIKSLSVQLDTATASTPVIESIATDAGVSDSDGITNDPTLIIQGTSDPDVFVELNESSLGVLGLATADGQGNWQFEITGAGLVDGDYEFFATAQTAAGSPSDPSAGFQVTVDTDSPLRAKFGLDPAFDTGEVGDSYTETAIVEFVGTTTPGANVLLVHDGQSTIADANGDFRFSGVNLLFGDHEYEVRTSDIAGNTQISRKRITFDQPVSLRDDSFVTQAMRTVALDSQASAKQTIKFRLNASLASTGSALSDAFMVYVVDPNQPGTTLIDRGENGTAAFSLVGDRAEFRAGAVRFDGASVEIDVSGFQDLGEVMLLFQLINNDDSNPAEVEVREIGLYLDQQGATSPVSRGETSVAPGSEIDLTTLNASSNLAIEFENLRYDLSSQRYTASLRVRNNGGDLGRTVAVSFADLPADVVLINGSGLDGNGDPYINLQDAIPSYGLLSGQRSDAVTVEFTAPTQSPFLNAAIAFDGGEPVAPVIDVVSDLTLMPGGVAELQLTATGQDFYFTMDNDGSLPDMELKADGRLRIAPKPGQEGSYSFNVYATDGVRQTSETIELDVVEDANTTTRISGFVMDTFSNPLPGIRVELGDEEMFTLADGSFELSFASGLPEDAALLVHGETYAGPEVYPFVAEKLPLLYNGNEPFENINNVISRPIYLPALDVANGVPIDPAVDVTVTTSTIPGAAVFVAAGSLETQSGGMFTGDLSITEVPAEFTPAALPTEFFPELVVTIQPGEMLFTTPAPLNLPNASGFPAGTAMSLWSINPVTGLFDDVGVGVVSADGSVVETVSGGIRNSSWHFFAPRPTPAVDASRNPNNESKDCDPCSDRGSPNTTSGHEQQPQSDYSLEIQEQEPATSHFQNDSPSNAAARNRRDRYSNNPSGAETVSPDFGIKVDSSGPRPTPASPSSGTRESTAATPPTSTSGSPVRSTSSTGTSSGWGRYSRLVTSSDGNSASQGTWGFSSKPTIANGFNVVPSATPTVNASTNPSMETSIALHSGAVHKSHELAAYQSLGLWRGLELHYDSERADSRPIINVGFQDIFGQGGTTLVTKLEISRGTMSMTVPGFVGTAPGLTGGEHFFSIPVEADSMEVSLQADMNNLPTGQYTYASTGRVARGPNFVGTSATTTDQFIHVNSRDSEFGVGWGLAGLTYLVENLDGSVLMVNGDGGELLFQAPLSEGQPYVSPAEDFSTLVKLGSGQFQRTHLNQTVESFSATHKLTSVTDRNGNQTQFLYNADDKLEFIVDPVGLTTTFRYVDGRVSEIEDPAGRITKLNYNQGNLVGIEDPDASSKAYRYDSANRLVGETDKRGAEESIEVDFSGRARSVTRKDGSTVNYTPAQTLNLVRPEKSSNPSQPAKVAEYRDQPVAQRADANGNVTQIVLDKAGQRLNSNDAQGNLPSVDRNENNLIQRVEDARGNITFLEYDDRGNVVSVSDEIARQNRQVVAFDSPVQSIASLDINQDGWLDLIVTLPESDAVAVSIANGDGTFGMPEEFDAGIAPTNVEAADLNGDGLADLVVAGELDQQLSVLFDDGFGFYEVGFSVEVIDLTSLEFADLDNDGDLDIVVGGRREFHALINNGDETFTKIATNVDAETGRNRVATGDFNGDGLMDVVVGAPNFLLFRNQIEVYQGNGDGTFDLEATVPVQGGSDDNVDWFLTEVVVADFDGDGSLDIAASTPYTNEAIINNVGLVFGNGDGTFEPAIGFASGFEAQSVATGDFNDDGIVDFVTANRDGTAIVTFGGENRTVDESREFTGGEGAREVLVGDFNGDGVDDFALANFDESNVSIHSPNLSGKIFEYDPVFNQLKRTVDEKGRVVLFEIDPTNGNTLSQTQVFGALGGGDDIVTSYTYTPQGLVETITDPLGRVTRRQYNSQGLVERETYAEGTTDEAFIEYEYDAAGNVTATINELGHRTEYIYDALNRVIQTIEADPDMAGPLESPVTVNGYDAQGNLTSVTDAEGKVTSFVYDAQHRLVETIDADGQAILHEYDAAGNISATIDRLGRRTEYVYDSRNRLIETINAAGGKTRREYDADNNLTTIVDENGVVTLYEYDSRNRLISTTNAIGGVTRYEYDQVDNLIAVTDELGRRSEMVYDEVNRLVETRGPDPDGVGPELSPVTLFVFDAASNLISTTDALGNTTVNKYDSRDRRVQTTTPDPDGAGPLEAPVTTYVYDDANRLTSIIDPLGREIQFVFDDLSRVIREIYPDPDGAGPEGTPIVRYTYDAVDNLITVSDELNRVTTFSYDDLHRQVTSTGADPDGAGPLAAPTVTTVYDVEGQVVAMVDPLGRMTSYEYDLLGRVVTTTLPDPDGSGPGTSPVMTYSYDAVGNEVSMVDALGNETIKVYDDLYRLTKTIEADPDGEQGPESNRVARFRYDDAHQLVAITDGLDRTKRFEYDDLGRVIAEYLPDPDGSGSQPATVIRYQHDLVGNRTSMIDALGNTTRYVYDGLYRLIETVGADPDGDGPELSPVTTNVFDVASQRTSVTDPIGRTTEFVYDNLGRVVEERLPDPDGTGPETNAVTQYDYDLVGNLRTRTDALGNSTSFIYDSLDRVTQVVESDPDGAGPQTNPITTYRYDVASQLTSIEDALGRVTTMEYDQLGREVSVTRPDPDGAGPLSAPTSSFTYDNMDNRLSSTDSLGNTTTFVYDNLYRLVSMIQTDPDDAGPQTNPTTTWRYDLVDQVVGVIDPLDRETTTEYDNLGRVVRIVMTDPDGAGPLTSPEMSYQYDVMSNQTSMIDAVGNETQYVYDNLYRRVRIVESDPDGAGPLDRPETVMAYDLAGQLLASTDELNRTTMFDYDDLGRMIRMVQPDPDGAGPLTAPEYLYRYDLMNNQIGATDPLVMLPAFVRAASLAA